MQGVREWVAEQDRCLADMGYAHLLYSAEYSELAGAFRRMVDSVPELAKGRRLERLHLPSVYTSRVMHAIIGRVLAVVEPLLHAHMRARPLGRSHWIEVVPDEVVDVRPEDLEWRERKRVRYALRRRLPHYYVLNRVSTRKRKAGEYRAPQDAERWFHVVVNVGTAQLDLLAYPGSHRGDLASAPRGVAHHSIPSLAGERPTAISIQPARFALFDSRLLFAVPLCNRLRPRSYVVLSLRVSASPAPFAGGAVADALSCGRVPPCHTGSPPEFMPPGARRAIPDYAAWARATFASPYAEHVGEAGRFPDLPWNLAAPLVSPAAADAYRQHVF